MTEIQKRFRRGMEVVLDGKPAKVTNISPGGTCVHVSANPRFGAVALNASEARRRVRVVDEPAENLLTPKQRQLLDRVRETRGLYLLGSVESRLGLRLQELGLVKLEPFRPKREQGRSGWWCELQEGRS
jgi:hypothetical protein